MLTISPNPDDYSAQFEQKQTELLNLLAKYDLPPLEAFASPPLHYRLRAEFKIWHDGDESHFAVFDQGAGNPPTFLTDFPTAAEPINRLMVELKAAIEQSDILRHKLFQVEFLSTLAGDMLVTFVYHKPLTDQWEQQARQLSDSLNIKIIGRSRKQKLVLSDDYVTEAFTIADQVFSYQQVEGCFSQPNGNICESMLNWAYDVTGDCSGDLLELYCGNGNFTLPLARHFDKVLATEISKRLTAAAQLNCNANNIDNVVFARMAAEDISSAMAGVREFRRLKDIDLSDYQFSTIFVDPPRAGLDNQTIELVKTFDRILYISCNPVTQADNLAALYPTHEIKRLAFFDQFPYTSHMECGMLLQKRS